MEKMREKAAKMRENIKKTKLLFTEDDCLLMIDAAKKRAEEYDEFRKAHPVDLEPYQRRNMK